MLDSTLKAIEHFLSLELNALHEGLPHAPKVSLKPLITLTTDYGCRGEEVAACLAEQLDVMVFNSAVLDALLGAESHHAPLLDALDKKVKPFWTAWLETFQHSQAEADFHRYQVLTNHCLHLLHSGGVIVGMGAHLILAQHPIFRVRLTGSEERCAQWVANTQHLDYVTARQKCRHFNTVEDKALIHQFHHSVEEGRAYDITLNMDKFADPSQAAMLLLHILNKEY